MQNPKHAYTLIPIFLQTCSDGIHSPLPPSLNKKLFFAHRLFLLQVSVIFVLSTKHEELQLFCYCWCFRIVRFFTCFVCEQRHQVQIGPSKVRFYLKKLILYQFFFACRWCCCCFSVVIC